MRIVKAENAIERMVLTGMIVDPVVCARISAKWQHDLFRSKWANLVAKWCYEYHMHYGKAPARHIETAFRAWERKTHDKDTVQLVERFLSGLSEEYTNLQQESNSDYILDKAGQHFSQVKIERLQDNLETDLTNGEVEKALGRIVGFDQVKIGQGEYIDIFNVKEEWKDAFAQQGDSIINYPHRLGTFFGTQLGRDCFVAFTGPEKRGKSMWLMELAFKAVTQRRRVAFFEAGDMSRRQIMRRMATRIAMHPRYATTLNWPIAIHLRKKEAKVLTEERTFDKPLDWRSTLKACRRMRRKQIRSKESYFRLVCAPNDTLHVKTIESTLREWERGGWLADVIIIDYCDILDMTWPKIEGRDRINKTWMQLRKLSQQFHCLLLTATQANAKSYDAKIIRKGHFSDDKRKHAHVTAMYGINQTDKEKAQGVYRLNCIELRDGEYQESNCIWVAGCPAVGNLAIKSVM